MDKTREEQYKATLRAARNKIRDLADENTELKRRLSAPGAPVAIVGMACEFPGGGDSCEAFRRMLLDGVDASGDIPSSRWDNSRYYSPVPGEPGKYYCEKGAFLDRDPFTFDNGFFGLSTAESEVMDPQQRLLLKQSWHAFEDAGIPPSDIRGSETGVFLGISSFDHMMSYTTPDLESRSDPYSLTGSSFNSAAGRLSYFYDIHGPCASVDTACSSSLVAVFLAVNALRNGECPVALAGGVNLLISPLSYIALCAIRAISVDGKSRAFGEGATGFSRGEGCGMVVLKRLEDARADGDRIHAVILGGAIGHDGQSAGFTAPSGPAQQRIIEHALLNAGVRTGNVAYVETHGTGTDLGDPIEAAALSDVFKEREGKLLIGSVKSNIGHLEAAAGVASLIKTVFAVRDAEIQPSLHADTLSPRIEWESAPIEVCRKRTPWPEQNSRRIAGVSSFGISGSGAHIILTEAPAETADVHDRSAAADFPDWRVLPVSAKDGDSLRDLASAYAGLLAEGSGDFNRLCNKAGRGRDHFGHRLAVCAESASSALESIQAYLDGKRCRTAVSGVAGERVRPVFVFSGQGSQTPGMGRELYRTHPVFHDTLDVCGRIASGVLGGSLLDVMFGEDGGILNRTLFTQPAVYAMEAALTDMWQSFGIRPSAVIGHSIGEYAAAYAAGVFSLEEGMEIVLERARLADGIETPGKMAAVLTDVTTAREFLAGTNVDIAAINGDDNLVISGPRDDVDAVLARMRDAGIEYREMPVSHSFHSPLIEPVLEVYAGFLSGYQFQKPAVRFISSMSAAGLDGDTDWPEYWKEQMRRTVRFSDALAVLGDVEVCLEIGTSPTLTSLCRAQTEKTVWLFSQGPSIPAWKQISLTLARLYVSGCPVGFGGGIFGKSAGAAVPLYPFRERHLRMSPQAMVREDTPFEMPDEELLKQISPQAVGNIMQMQVSSMKRLFNRQLETLGRLSHEEPESHE